MFKELREFALKGNVVDMGVGIIMGAAFGKIVASFVGDIVMPPLGLVLGKTDFSNLFVSLSGTPYASLALAKQAGAPTLNLGVFAQTVIDFSIIALVMFLLVKQVNRLKKAPQPPPAPATRECPYCLSAIPVKARRCAHCTSALEAA